MNANRISEQALEMVWAAMARYPLGEYLPAASLLGKMTQLSNSSIHSAYNELHRRGYLERRGKYFVKIMDGAFVSMPKNKGNEVAD